MTLPNQRLESLDQALNAVGVDQWRPVASSSANVSLTPRLSVERDGKDRELVPAQASAQALLDAVLELMPRPYAADKHGLWLCGLIVKGAEQGSLYIRVAEPLNPPQPGLPEAYRLDPVPPMLGPGDFVMMTGEIRKDLVDTQQGGVNYECRNWSRWGDGRVPVKTSPTPSLTPKGSPRVGSSPNRKTP